MSTTKPVSTPAARIAAGELGLRELLHDRNFSLYLAGCATSGFGSVLSTMALTFAVLDLSRSAAGLGLVLLCSRLPGIALTLTGGVIADRVSRRTLALWTDAFRTLLQACTAVILLSGHTNVAVLAGLQTLAGGAGAIFAPAAAAMVAGIAPGGQVRRTNSLLGIATAISQTGGLALSGVIVALAGLSLSFMIDSATFAVSTVTLALIRLPFVAPKLRRGALGELREGWRSVFARRWLVVCAFHETVVNVLALGPFFVLGPLVAKQSLGGVTGWSAIALGYVLGNLAAAHVTYHWAPRRPIVAVLLVNLALAPLLVLLGLCASVWLCAPAAALMGASSTVYNTLVNSAVQSNVPDQVLARTMAITGLGSTVLAPLGMGLAGVVAASIGAPAVLIGGALLVVLVSLICGALPAARVQLRLDQEVP